MQELLRISDVVEYAIYPASDIPVEAGTFFMVPVRIEYTPSEQLATANEMIAFKPNEELIAAGVIPTGLMLNPPAAPLLVLPDCQLTQLSNDTPIGKLLKFKTNANRILVATQDFNGGGDLGLK